MHIMDSRWLWCVNVDVSIVTKEPLKWEMLIVGEGVGALGRGMWKICHFCEYIAVNLKNKVYFKENEEVRKKEEKRKTK